QSGIRCKKSIVWEIRILNKIELYGKWHMSPLLSIQLFIHFSAGAFISPPIELGDFCTCRFAFAQKIFAFGAKNIAERS
ncbi:hypothetical protein, partial [Metasolibacillus meyeri]|uniref:hypothetical protein n=1 Tax=Metasolibacillus meyeri TaxID=1071052 RepID=UPI001EE6A1DB